MMSETARERLLAGIAASDGKDVRDEVEQLLAIAPQCSNPLTLVRLAKQRLYAEQYEAGAATAARSFASDGDL